MRRHPVLTALFAICIAAGAVAGLALLPQEWSVLRRALGGAVSGAGAALLVAAPRMLG